MSAPALPRRLATAVWGHGPLWRRARRRLILLGRRRSETVSFRRGGFRWTGFTWDDGITWELYIHGGFQEEEREAVAGWMRRHGQIAPGRDLVIEVGANLGTTTLPLARREGLRVVAIEPVPGSFRLLERNVRDNGLEDRVRCVHRAVHGRSGPLTMVTTGRTSGGAEVGVPGRVLESERSGTVAEKVRARERAPASTFGELLAELSIDPGSVAFVWSDTQGSDGHVLAGGERLWRSGVPLYMELWPGAMRHQGSFDAVDRAASLGFASFIEAERLKAGADPDPRPIAELADLCASLRGEFDQTDVLLIPAARRA